MVNVFVSHYNPVAAARALPNLLCQRMCLEAAEILCGVHWNLRFPDAATPSRELLPDGPQLAPYRRSLGQRKHPIVLWAGADRAHYVWLLRHMQALAKEHVLRYPNSQLPAPYQDTFEWLAMRKHKVPTMYTDPVVQASDVTFYGAFNQTEFLYVSTDIRIQYRLSLLYKWLYEYTRNHSWYPRHPPNWAFDIRLRKILHKIYGNPTTPTAKNALQM